jgi:hypothetical protein
MGEATPRPLRIKELIIVGKTICVVCAWRETCQKKFSISARDIKCADYVKDLSIKEEKEEKPQKSETKNK